MQFSSNKNKTISFCTEGGWALPRSRWRDLLGQRDASMVSHYEHGRALPPLAVALSLEIIYRAPVAFLFPDMYDELKKEIRAQEESLAGAGQQPLFPTN